MFRNRRATSVESLAGISLELSEEDNFFKLGDFFNARVFSESLEGHNRNSGCKKEQLACLCRISRLATTNENQFASVAHIRISPRHSSHPNAIRMLALFSVAKHNTLLGPTLGMEKMCPAYGKVCNKCSNSRMQMWSDSGSR